MIVAFSRLVCISAIGLLALSCGGSKSAVKDFGSADQEVRIFPKSIEDLMNKRYKESIKAVGFAGSPDIEIARSKAMDDASDKIARQFKQEVSFWDKRFQNELNGTQLEDYQKTTQQFGNVTLQGIQNAKEVMTKGKDGYMVYVLLVISFDTFQKLLNDQKDALTVAKATKAYKELEDRVAREKAVQSEFVGQE